MGSKVKRRTAGQGNRTAGRVAWGHATKTERPSPREAPHPELFTPSEQRVLDLNLVAEVLFGQPEFAVNEPRDSRSGTLLMIGPDVTGRMWTIVILQRRGRRALAADNRLAQHN